MKANLALCLALLAAAHAASAQDWAKAKLEQSPRHGEWVEVKNGSRTVRCYIVYPEVKDPAPAVLVIHEIFGLSDWARDETDQLAAAGYVAIAPDLLSGLAPNGGGTSDFSGRDAVTEAVSKLPANQVTADLDAVAEYVKKLPAVNGKLAVAGFCWGGGKSFGFATHRTDLKAAFVFYGLAPKDPAQIAKITCPVYGFYAGNDARVSTSIPDTEKLMTAAGKTYEPVTYDGAGHGFMRAGEDPQAGEANKTAHDQAWERWKKLLGKL